MQKSPLTEKYVNAITIQTNEVVLDKVFDKETFSVLMAIA